VLGAGARRWASALGLGVALQRLRPVDISPVATDTVFSMGPGVRVAVEPVADSECQPSTWRAGGALRGGGRRARTSCCEADRECGKPRSCQTLVPRLEVAQGEKPCQQPWLKS
jgi:hypothetical protein